MNLTVVADVIRDEVIYTLRVPRRDIVMTRLDAFDRAVVFAPANSIADALQSLQVLAFRMEQALDDVDGRHLRK